MRGLYALHHGILNSRNIGGPSGTIIGPFATQHLLRSTTLGAYVDFLDSALDNPPANEAGENDGIIQDGNGNNKCESSVCSDHHEKETSADPLYESLVLAIMLGYATVASALLDLGVDPNGMVTSIENQGRLGKIKDRKQQRSLFKSNPLHLACSRGDPFLVGKLLSKG